MEQSETSEQAPAPAANTVREVSIELDGYNSDLNFIIDKSGLAGSSHSGSIGFAYLWAGARADWGVRRGKVCFEATISKHTSIVTGLMDDTPTDLLHLARFGWSVTSHHYSLGEELNSFGYGATGKSAAGKSFRDYGESFGIDDTITCYLDMESSPGTISYAKNGKHLGEAFAAVVLSDDSALFPHVLLKNAGVTVNFGATPPRYPLSEGYCMVQDAEASCLQPGPAAPATFNDCSVLMMVGLPASGKTTWTKKHQQDHPEKCFNILGTNAIMEEMRVHNLARKRNYHGRFEQLMQMASKVHECLSDISKSRRRNFILDQTNVYGSARRRKINKFRQFGSRHAVVVVVCNEELCRRTSMREAQEGKLVPEAAVQDMKRNFVLPQLNEGFTEVIYAEEPEETARAIVSAGKTSGFSARSQQGQGDGEPSAKRPFSSDHEPGDHERLPSLLGEYRGRQQQQQQQWQRHDASGGQRQTGPPERRPLMDHPPAAASRQQYAHWNQGPADWSADIRTEYGHGPNSHGRYASPRGGHDGRRSFPRQSPGTGHGPSAGSTGASKPLMGDWPGAHGTSTPQAWSASTASQGSASNASYSATTAVPPTDSSLRGDGQSETAAYSSQSQTYQATHGGTATSALGSAQHGYYQGASQSTQPSASGEQQPLIQQTPAGYSQATQYGAYIASAASAQQYGSGQSSGYQSSASSATPAAAPATQQPLMQHNPSYASQYATQQQYLQQQKGPAVTYQYGTAGTAAAYPTQPAAATAAATYSQQQEQQQQQVQQQVQQAQALAAYGLAYSQAYAQQMQPSYNPSAAAVTATYAGMGLATAPTGATPAAAASPYAALYSAVPAQQAAPTALQAQQPQLPYQYAGQQY